MSLQQFFQQKYRFSSKTSNVGFSIKQWKQQYRTPFTPRTLTYGDVVIEHVDFYGSVHTLCVVVRRRQLCPLTTTVSSIYLASAVSCVDVRRRTQCERGLTFLLPLLSLSKYCGGLIAYHTTIARDTALRRLKLLSLLLGLQAYYSPRI